jgi:1-acyl-sn-glycerol-3-phosphate acyltransferase
MSMQAQHHEAGAEEHVPRKPSTEADLLHAGAGTLDMVARAQIRFIQRSLQPGPLDRALRWCQKQIGARWINASLTNLRQVHGVERLPELRADESFLLVSNHRSFFDLYAVSAYLVASGLPHRLLFPVRANFFYDNPLGPLVNGVMSFFAMYPPIFRQPSRAAFNLAGLDEIVRLLKQGGVFVGVHPEGTRKKDDDPYTLLPPQSGVGRLIYHAGVPVIPVFINGLGNSIPKQVAGNVTKKGSPVHIVFGAPIDFGDLREVAPSPRAYKRLSERALEAIHGLGQEEKELRARGVN